MRLLDLCCGGGGASDGYVRAGFDVVGVDIDRQPWYPYEFVQADALTYPLAGFDVVHVSPPCQPYSRSVTSRSSRWADTKGKDEPALIDAFRARLRAAGIPYVIENVEGSPLDGIRLCGSMFGLDIRRHRIFESSEWLWQPWHPACSGRVRAAAERRGWDYREMSVTGKGRSTGTSVRWAELLGISRTMRQHDYKEAIPPAYTEWIGRQLIATIR